MTTLLPYPDTKAEDEKMKEPAKRWRNKWRALNPKRVFRDRRTGRVHECDVGGIMWGDTIYPSREVAESSAAESVKINVSRGTNDIIDYLGAFPVKE